MAKKPNESDKHDRQHLRNLSTYQLRIDRLYHEIIREAARIGASVGEIKPDTAFSFADYPTIRKRVEKLMSGLKSRLTVSIVNAIDAEWTLANNKNSELARRVFGDNATKLSPAQQRRYFSTNDNARQAFQQRKVNGLNLSERVWRYADQFKEEIEMGLDLGIRNGLSAQEMTRDLRDYLRHPDKLFRRVRDEHGILHLSKRAAAYHPGRGVYRSSYMNARRLAATEANIAYRTSDHLRWQQMDFVVGIEIRLSDNHTCKGPDGKPRPFTDMCDKLAGRYPKDFKFTSWHPMCRCYAISILKTQEEIAEDTRKILNGEKPDGNSVNRVDDVPQEFKEWVENNKERAKGWATMPYFIRDNPQYIQGFEVDTYSPMERIFTRHRRTNEAMSESLGIYLQSKYPNIPNTEKAAIYHYTRGDTSAFRQLNNQLRKGKLSEFNEAFAKLLSAGLSKIPPIEATVYRTIRLNRTLLAEFNDMANRQAQTVFKGFSSASMERSRAVAFAEAHKGRKKNETDVLLVIRGKSGHPIEQLSQFSGRFAGKPNQREVLFDSGCEFRFDRMAIENGFKVYYLTEI